MPPFRNFSGEQRRSEPAMIPDIHAEQQEKEPEMITTVANANTGSVRAMTSQWSKNLKITLAALLLMFWTIQPRLAPAQTSVLTWHYNNARNAVDSTETVLTPANVNVRGFGKLYSRPLDGLVVGHPLYMPGLNIPGSGVHNVVFVATMEDSVYAFDVENPTAAPLWQTSLLTYSPAGAVPVADKFKGCQVTTDWTDVGVVSTPAIDSTTNTMYLLAETYENKKVVHRLHAIDVTTGVEKLNGPTTVTGTYTLNGVTNTFVDTHQMNRPGLLLANGNIYVGFGSAGCNGGDSGWIMSYNATTMAPNGALDIEAGEFFASIWQKGAGLSADSTGNIYGESGEGPVTGPGTPGENLGTSVFKVSQVGSTLTVADWFTPYNWSYLYSMDLDLHNGVLILPDQPGPHPHEAIGIGKEGTIYLLDRDNMGHLCTACTTMDTQIVQELLLADGKGAGTPLIFNGNVYFTGGHVVSVYPITNGKLVTPPTQSAMFASGGHPIMTADGTKNAILWGGSGGLLWAMDPSTMQVIWTTNLAMQRRDILPTTAHFAVPMIADGKLFIGGLRTLVVYGLLPVLSGGNGNNQTGTVTTALPKPITVQAIDTLTGKGLPGVTISFSDVKTGGGSFSPASGVTDSTGTVSTTYTLSTKSGTYTVTAASLGYAPASFTETATATTPVKMIRSAGSGQVVPLSTLVPKPLVAKVEDQYGNGVAGVSVTFADGVKGGTFSANPVITDSTGLASVNYTSSTKAGPATITAAVPGLTTLNIFVTVTPNPASSVIVSSGSGQKAAPSTLLPRALVAKVTDNFGNAISGASVSFSDGGAGGTFSANPVTTITAGTASVKYTTPATAGTVTVTATVTGISTTASFTVTVN
jgi:hypothetical protein